MRKINHYIDGASYTSESQRCSDACNPAIGEVIAKVSLANEADLEFALSSAEKAFKIWSAVNPQKRARVLLRFLQLVENAKMDLAEALSKEHGKTIEDSLGEIQRGIEIAEFCVGAPHLLKGEYSSEVGTDIDMYSLRQPLGIVAGITPFNFPAMIPLWKICPAISCGNAFILKPSEKNPTVPLMIAELFSKAGLPDGVLNVLNGDKQIVDLIIQSPKVKAVGFVGSSAIAHYVYSECAKYGKRSQTFGGAKNHVIVMPDADVELASNAIIGAAYGSAGERCMAISAVVCVGGEIADKLMASIKDKASKLKVGPYNDPESDFGPLITKAAFDRVLDYVEQGVFDGASLILDRRHLKVKDCRNGFFIGPCLFDKVVTDMSIYKDEIFGPVLVNLRVDSLEKALQLASEHPYGNGVSIYTKDGAAARQFVKEVNVGMVGVNIPVPVPLSYYTFGGWKSSGFGDLNQHGADAFRFYTKTKTVTSRWFKNKQIIHADFNIPVMK